MRSIPILLLIIFSIASCQETNSDTNYLKEKIVLLEARVDSLEKEIQKLSEAKPVPSTKRKANSKLATVKPVRKEDSIVLTQKSKEPVEKATEENQYIAPQTSSKNVSQSHSSSSTQCMGTTKRGARCKRMVRGGNYCWQHGG